MKKKNKLLLVIGINLLIFGITNIIFNLKYEQVDDFIIYNLYSGLDGSYHIQGIYIHPLICLILSILYRILPMVNWHTIFLLSMQFICFTLIGYTVLKKQDNGISIILYIIFASVFYTTLLLLIQYTSVAALLILTSFLLVIDKMEQAENGGIKSQILVFSLFTVGIMIRMQSLLIVVPFMAIYFIIYLIGYKQKRIEKKKIIKMLQQYGIYIILTVIVYVSHMILYQSDSVYKKYTEYNDLRATLHDIIYVDYEENKEIFDEIGWSENDYYMFYTFNYGDENIYSKENLEKILDYKMQKDGKNLFNTNIAEIEEKCLSEWIDTNTYIAILFFIIFFISLWNHKKMLDSILIGLTTLGVHLLFIAINRSMLRVVIPEYILGTALLIYHLNLPKKIKVEDNIKNIVIVISMVIALCTFSGKKYQFGYQLEDYHGTRELIDYTNQHKENVYLYTSPSLQFRYLAYSVYQMPPKGAFSNLRVIGGWDIFTKNYYDFKERYQLDGNLLDLLKENVYLVDGDVIWSGRRYSNYKENVFLAIKENYNIEVKGKEIQQFDNLKIYKVYQEEK